MVVAAALVHKAIGHQLTCIYVDTGLMRKGESHQVVETFRRNLGIELIHVDAGWRFFDALEGVTEPEAKRKAIGEQFIRVFEENTGGLTDAKWLVQGTLYPDLIESGINALNPIEPYGMDIQTVKREFGRDIASGKEAREIYRIGTFYKDADETLADFQAGTAPDVFDGCCSSFPVWAQQGYALDLRPYVAADLDQETLDDWDPIQYRAFFTRDGLQYGLPKYHGSLALYYNKDLLDKDGVDYPDETWDYDDYLAAMRSLTHDLDGDGKVDQWGSQIDFSWERIQVHINAWGGHLVDPDDPTRPMFAEAPALQVAEGVLPLAAQQPAPAVEQGGGVVALAAGFLHQPGDDMDLEAGRRRGQFLLAPEGKIFGKADQISCGFLATLKQRQGPGEILRTVEAGRRKGLNKNDFCHAVFLIGQPFNFINVSPGQPDSQGFMHPGPVVPRKN